MAQVLSEFLIGFSPVVFSVVFVVDKVALKQVFLRVRQLFLASYATMLHTHNASGTGYSRLHYHTSQSRRSA